MKRDYFASFKNAREGLRFSSSHSTIDTSTESESSLVCKRCKHTYSEGLVNASGIFIYGFYMYIKTLCGLRTNPFTLPTCVLFSIHELFNILLVK